MHVLIGAKSLALGCFDGLEESLASQVFVLVFLAHQTGFDLQQFIYQPIMPVIEMLWKHWLNGHQFLEASYSVKVADGITGASGGDEDAFSPRNCLRLLFLVWRPIRPADFGFGLARTVCFH